MFSVLLSLAWFIHTKRLSPCIASLGVELTQIMYCGPLVTVRKPLPKYVSVIIVTAVSQSFFLIIWPERVRATRGTTTAGLVIGITNASSQLMGIVGLHTTSQKFGPTYRVRYICSIVLLAMCLGVVSTRQFFTIKDDRRHAYTGNKKYCRSKVIPMRERTQSSNRRARVATQSLQDERAQVLS